MGDDSPAANDDARKLFFGLSEEGKCCLHAVGKNCENGGEAAPVSGETTNDVWSGLGSDRASRLSFWRHLSSSNGGESSDPSSSGNNKRSTATCQKMDDIEEHLEDPETTGGEGTSRGRGGGGGVESVGDNVSYSSCLR